MIIIIHINLHGNQLYCLVHVERLIWEVILHVLQCSREAVLLNGVHGLLEWDVNKIRHTNLRSGLSSPRSGFVLLQDQVCPECAHSHKHSKGSSEFFTSQF